ncbi:acyl homoserine lactone synthase [Alteromonadaceae bacterium 2753L.S.0a.02]|nr:acyl homoserine lactone synthase [Alteromonadaceae bacterium 2753L.S.0a.02]
MSKVTFHKNNLLETTSSSVVEEIYKLRHETFVERLEWEVNSENGAEKDQFDTDNAINIAVSGYDDQLQGCWRALPTTGEYMLKDVFPELLQGEEAPQEPEVWEISRFAVRKGTSSVAKGFNAQVTVAMVKSFWDFAIENNVRAYVAVTTVACERMLRQLGVTLRRMGEGESLQIGKEKSVALYIEVDRNLNITAH